MKRNRFWFTCSLSLFSIGYFALNSPSGFARAKDTGDKGAQVYCFMRKTGNEHEVSWNAAYALIKRQSNSMFKTSPKHAAVMIIEAVVDNPNAYDDCGGYLGELFGGKTQNQKENNSPNKLSVIENENRYNY